MFPCKLPRMSVMPNRIKQIGRKDEVTRVNEYHWYSPIYRADRGREMTPLLPPLPPNNRRNFSIFVSCIMEQPVIRRKTMAKRATVRSLIALPHRAPLPRIGWHFWRNMWFEPWNVKALSPSFVRLSLVCVSISNSARYFQYRCRVRAICHSSTLSIFGATLKLRATRQESWFFFPVKVNCRDFSLTLLPILWSFYNFNYYLFDSTQ